MKYLNETMLTREPKQYESFNLHTEMLKTHYY
jgi:hypothetical protein